MTGLRQEILRLIRAQGPISVAQYMQVALTDPIHGYYIRSDPLARDFITAPEVSQMFGELLGLFFVQAFQDRGRPGKFSLVELGPGRGTLMADMLRAAKVWPAFLDAAEILLIEASPALRAVQASSLRDRRVKWAGDFHAVVDDVPLFLIANEFFDALPMHQFIHLSGRWHERMIKADGDALMFAASDPVPDSLFPAHLSDASEGAVFEASPAAHALASKIGARVARNGGVALIIDYGHALSGFGDTFQAVKANRYADPLAEPGEADLTAHVDFAALSAAARKTGARVWGPVTQAPFLGALGIEERAARLRTAAPNEAADIDAAIDRLVGEEQMGNLFKVMALAAPDSPPPPGFPC